MRRLDIIEAIWKERAHQDRLRSEGRFPHTCADKDGLDLAVKHAVLSEEVGEVGRAVLNELGLVREEDSDLKRELIQVAAVAVAWLESLE